MKYEVTIEGVTLSVLMEDYEYADAAVWPSGDPYFKTANYIAGVEVGGVDITTLLSEDVADQIIKAIKAQYGVEVEF